ncbi:MAG: peptidase M28, partial [Altibacter sp.]|nr:peptidase M28 [Altibacter sp.]
MKKRFLLLLCFLTLHTVFAQNNDPVIDNIVKEATENSQLQPLGHELMDLIGPRLVGTPQMKNAHDWAVAKYASWGIPARNEAYGEWRGWERGITHIDMIHPRVQSLRGTQLAWNPGTSKQGVTAEVIILPTVKDSLEFVRWLPNVKGKLVLIDMLEPTGRPDYNWEEFATEASFAKMKEEREQQTTAWRDNMKRMGYSSRTLPTALEA